MWKNRKRVTKVTKCSIFTHGFFMNKVQYTFLEFQFAPFKKMKHFLLIFYIGDLQLPYGWPDYCPGIQAKKQIVLHHVQQRRMRNYIPFLYVSKCILLSCTTNQNNKKKCKQKKYIGTNSQDYALQFLQIYQNLLNLFGLKTLM